MKQKKLNYSLLRDNDDGGDVLLNVKGGDISIQLRQKSSCSYMRLLCVILLVTVLIGVCFQFNLLWYLKKFIVTEPDVTNARTTVTPPASVNDGNTVMSPSVAKPYCPAIPSAQKFDCYPADGGGEEKCTARGCCWEIPAGQAVTPSLNPTAKEYNDTLLPPLSVPYCYYPADYPSYSMVSHHETPLGFTGTLTRTTSSPYPRDVMTLQLDVMLETRTRLHFKIFDPASKRYEVPIETPKVTKKSDVQDYQVEVSSHPFSISVTRKSTGAVIFDTSVGSMIFSDQFIQLSSVLPSAFIYGLGEHTGSFLINTNWTRIALWTRDHFPVENANLYGVHPFYIVMEEDGSSHGVFLLNSNAMENMLQPLPAITFRTLGGILDFYIFAGPSPAAVIQQYQQVIGLPAMPPYWGLGFHLCRWGYGNSKNMTTVIKRMRDAEIPYDVQWNDIDYMSKHLDFTLDENNFIDLNNIVADLHADGMHYVPMTDCGISSTQGPGNYTPFDQGMAMDIFIKVENGSMPILGKVWPGITAFPDFTHPRAEEYWSKQIADFHKVLDFDGLWIDMNEPASSVPGSVYGCDENSTFDYPIYTPGIVDESLLQRTLCPSAKQYAGSHYNLHSLYGLTEMRITQSALLSLTGKRPFIISRSSYASAGKHGGHWLGDNASQWKDMYLSIPGILSFSLFGVPLVGADVCGFRDDTTEEMCQRWMQLGAFYPFFRNHNSLGQKDQDPAAFSKAMQASTRKALNMRYRLLPYLYTLFHRASHKGGTVARPLFFEFPTEQITYSIDKQFMWGEALLISPVLTQGDLMVVAYFPIGRWYNLFTNETVHSNGQYQMLDAPLDTINVHLREGYIVPTQDPAVTTTQSRKNNFGLLVGLPSSGIATGHLFWDDGETINTFESGSYNSVRFNASLADGIMTTVTHTGFPTSMVLGSVNVYGMEPGPLSVTVNGKPASYQYDASKQLLRLYEISEDFLKPISILWRLPERKI